MSAFSSSAFSTSAFSVAAFDFGTSPPVVATIDTFLPEDKKRFRKTPPGNIRFIYDKIKDSAIEPDALLEAIEPYVEEEVFEEAAAAGKLPEIADVDYAALAADDLAYSQFTAALDNIKEKLKIAAEKQQAEDDELLLLAVFACTIN